MVEGVVHEKVCHIIQDGCNKEKAVIGRRLDKHGEELDSVKGELTDLKMILARVTDLLERTVDTVEELSKPQPRFFESDSGKLVIKTACAVIMVLTAAAVGMNYYREYLEVLLK